MEWLYIILAIIVLVCSFGVGVGSSNNKVKLSTMICGFIIFAILFGIGCGSKDGYKKTAEKYNKNQRNTIIDELKTTIQNDPSRELFTLKFVKDNIIDLPKRSKLRKCKITLIQQFFINKDPDRYSEIKYCLQKNVNNPYLTKIILLNEKIYTADELGVDIKDMGRIKQINVGTRLTYKIVLDYVYGRGKYNTRKLSGYIVFGNSDIYYDETIINLCRTSLSKTNSWYIQSRHEHYSGKIEVDMKQSQDSWMFHTRSKKVRTADLDFFFGMPGCDNASCYKCIQNDIYVFNNPLLIKSWHVHKELKRDYQRGRDTIASPYVEIIPDLNQL